MVTRETLGTLAKALELNIYFSIVFTRKLPIIGLS